MKEAEVKVLLDKHGLFWSDFNEWMIGQTVSSDEKGNIIYWSHDVVEFIRLKKDGITSIDFD